MIRDLGQRRTVLLSTHILSEVEVICPRVIIISDGRIVGDDRTERLTSRLDTSDRFLVQARGLGEAMRRALQELPGVRRVVWQEKAGGEGVQSFLVEGAKDAGLREKALEGLRQHDWPLVQFERCAPTLEDVFATLTKTADVVGHESPADGSKA
jgi:ABC-2 type transport system ATP-binding protein